MRMDENRRLYEKHAMGARYAKQSALQPAEAAILRRYRDDISGGRILDLGVGGGRTTPFLVELSRDYIGIDYSPAMVERCRQRFPGVRFALRDARDLSCFAGGSFDFVLFSYNGIDAVGHRDRLKILREVYRVLGQGALFVVSSHNRNFPIPKPWALRHLAINPLRHPLRFARRAAAYGIGIINYVRKARQEEIQEEYCVLVDSAHRYALVHYHITLAAQVRQLERLGFREIEAFGVDGRLLSQDMSDDVQDPWLQYVCRRPATATSISAPDQGSVRIG